ncbi:hypothetical protein VNO77_05564 [Canavalia gladiata]|uniref:Uncharacterized protein n=1 Tax=Canavalia gladiata TaxID=3824 RepID=A0AAN9MZC4_CANGL
MANQNERDKSSSFLVHIGLHKWQMGYISYHFNGTFSRTFKIAKSSSSNSKGTDEIRSDMGPCKVPFFGSMPKISTLGDSRSNANIRRSSSLFLKVAVLAKDSSDCC